MRYNRTMEKEYNDEGYEIVYISKPMYEILDEGLLKVARGHHNSMGQPTICIRDAKAMIEFRRLDQK